jgi:HSP20 family molecular chaperone IbpA
VVAAAVALSAMVCSGAWAGGLFSGWGKSSSADGASLSIPAMRVEETPDAYKVTLSAAEADSSKLRASLDGQTLIISAGSNSTGPSCAQNIQLPAADSSKEITVNREKNDLVISVAKGKGIATVTSNGARRGSTGMSAGAMPNIDQFGAMAGQMRQQFAQMQKQMDAMMGGSGAADPLASFFGGGFPSAQPAAGKVTVEDNGKEYVIRANNMGEKAQLNVAVENGNVLKITTSDEDTAGGQQAQSYQTSQATQMMTLPAAVLSSKMTTKREGDAVVVTLPKA